MNERCSFLCSKLKLVQVTTSYMKQISSYVMQDDQLFPMLTVLETLTFAAEVRLPPSLSRAEKLKRVWELIEQLGLQVGNPLILPIIAFLNESNNNNTRLIYALLCYILDLKLITQASLAVQNYRPHVSQFTI